MTEYIIENVHTGEETFIFGHTYDDALNRYGINKEDAILVCETYID